MNRNQAILWVTNLAFLLILQSVADDKDNKTQKSLALNLQMKNPVWFERGRRGKKEGREIFHLKHSQLQLQYVLHASPRRDLCKESVKKNQLRSV